MDAGSNGREFIHGLTRELTSVPGQLATNPPQTKPVQNWAVGFYSAPGGFIIGQVWWDPTNPHSYPDHVSRGYGFRQTPFHFCPLSQVPFLAGSVQLQPNINPPAPTPPSPHTPVL